MLASARGRIGDGRDPSGLARARRDLRSAPFTKRFLHRPGRGCNARTHAVAVDEGGHTHAVVARDVGDLL
jgi:hypothetical protein